MILINPCLYNENIMNMMVSYRDKHKTKRPEYFSIDFDMWTGRYAVEHYYNVYLKGKSDHANKFKSWEEGKFLEMFFKANAKALSTPDVFKLKCDDVKDWSEKYKHIVDFTTYDFDQLKDKTVHVRDLQIYHEGMEARSEFAEVIGFSRHAFKTYELNEKYCPHVSVMYGVTAILKEDNKVTLTLTKRV